jgi:AcrR family transcriptional regulator
MSLRPTRRSTTRALQKQKTREHVYTTAMRLFDAHGYEQVGIDDVVRASGVARGTFYFHFPTKEDVLLEAVRRGEGLIVERLAGLRATARLRRVLTATVLAFIEAWGERRELLPHAGAVALRRIAGVRAESDRDPLRLELGRRVQQAQERGELRSPLPGGMLADIFLLHVFAALMTWSTTGEPAADVLVAGVVELFFGGVEGLGRAGRVTPSRARARSRRAGGPPR